MKIDGSDWKERIPPEKSEGEILFDRLLLYRQFSSISAERLRIIKELERLLVEDQLSFPEYLLGTIHFYEAECNLDVNDFEPRLEGIEALHDLYYDKNTTLSQYLYKIRTFILEFMQELKALWDKGQIDEIAEKLKDVHRYDVSQIINAKK